MPQTRPPRLLWPGMGEAFLLVELGYRDPQITPREELPEWGLGVLEGSQDKDKVPSSQNGSADGISDLDLEMPLKGQLLTRAIPHLITSQAMSLCVPSLPPSPPRLTGKASFLRS